VDVSMAQDAEVCSVLVQAATGSGLAASACKLVFYCCSRPQVGDGTTSVVILAGEFLKEAKPFVEEGVHPRVSQVSVRLS
jgi:hypothetical protein